jgi:hypothetical protein
MLKEISLSRFKNEDMLMAKESREAMGESQTSKTAGILLILHRTRARSAKGDATLCKNSRLQDPNRI